ncbi:MAG: hypothetical protein AAF492_05250, partial [Verrucomicrobiota bacterium]
FTHGNGSGELDLETEYTYDPTFRKMTSRTDAEGNTVQFVHDARGNLVRKVEPMGKTTQYFYDPDGFMKKTTDPDGRDTVYTRDTFDYVEETLLTGYAGELAIKTVTRRDVMNMVHTIIDPNGNTTLQSHDNLDRLIGITHPAVESFPNGPPVNPSTRYEYDLNGNRTSSRDPNGVLITTIYDPLDRQITSTIDMGGGGSNITHNKRYNEIGLVKTETDPRGHTTTFSYDALLRLTNKVYAINTIAESYTYTANFGSGAFALSGWVPTTVINPRGCVTVNSYDGAYRLTNTVRSSCGNTASSGSPTLHYTYDKVHNKTSQRVENTDCNGNTADQITDYRYDDLYRLTAEEVHMPNGNFVTAFTYDLAGNKTSVTDAEGHTTDYVIDGAHRQVEIIQPTVPISAAGGPATSGRPTITYVYDNNGNITEESDPNGNRTQNTWDALNRKSSSTLDLNRNGNFFDPDDIRTQFHYDLVTHLIRKIDPEGSEWDYAYDNAYRLITETAPAVEDEENGGLVRPITTTEFDQNSNVTGIVDPRDVRTEYGYDDLNRRTSETKAVGTAVEVVTTTMYDNNGNIDSLTLHNGANPQVTSYVYDDYDRKIKETRPLGRITIWTHDEVGNVLTETDPKGQLIEHCYDQHNRRTRTDFHDTSANLTETWSFGHDNVDNIISATDAAGSSTYVYDALYRVTGETRFSTNHLAYTVGSAYDANGNRTQCAFPGTGRSLTSHYDARNLLDQLDDSINGTTFYAYDKNGNRTSCTLPNGNTTTNTFDAINRVLTMATTNLNGLILFNMSNGYDLVGNRLWSHETLANHGTRSSGYTYDDQYRLTVEEHGGPAPGIVTTSYSYDPAGNRLSMFDGTTMTSNAYDALNQLTSMDTGGTLTSMAYDPNGNRTSKTIGSTVTTYTYDVPNRLLNVSEHSNLLFEATYDYRTRRQTTDKSGTETFFRYDQGVTCQEFKDGNLAVEFVRANGLGGGIGSILYSDRSGINEYFIYNPVGHTVG